MQIVAYRPTLGVEGAVCRELQHQKFTNLRLSELSGDRQPAEFGDAVFSEPFGQRE